MIQAYHFFPLLPPQITILFGGCGLVRSLAVIRGYHWGFAILNGIVARPQKKPFILHYFFVDVSLTTVSTASTPNARHELLLVKIHKRFDSSIF